MKIRIFFSFLFIISIQAISYSQIKWMSFNDAIKENATNKRKKVFVDVFTDWCGWCKQMDKTTFQDPTIVEYMNKNFLAVKMNAEMKDTIVFNNFTWTNPNPMGNRSPHSIAKAMLNDEMSYPTFVMLDEDFNRMDMQKGFKDSNFLKGYLEFYIYEKYKKEDEKKKN